MQNEPNNKVKQTPPLSTLGKLEEFLEPGESLNITFARVLCRGSQGERPRFWVDINDNEGNIVATTTGNTLSAALKAALEDFASNQPLTTEQFRTLVFKDDLTEIEKVRIRAYVDKL